MRNEQDDQMGSEKGFPEGFKQISPNEYQAKFAKLLEYLIYTHFHNYRNLHYQAITIINKILAHLEVRFDNQLQKILLDKITSDKHEKLAYLNLLVMEITVYKDIIKKKLTYIKLDKENPIYPIPTILKLMLIFMEKENNINIFIQMFHNDEANRFMTISESIRQNIQAKYQKNKTIIESKKKPKIKENDPEILKKSR